LLPFYTAGRKDRDFNNGIEMALRAGYSADLSGPVATAEFRILSRNGATLEIIPMTQSGSDFQGVFTPPSQPFRLAVEGKDTEGAAFRRVHAPLLDTKP
jgi:hypothetical protein